jgi:hypothetical protein
MIEKFAAQAAGTVDSQDGSELVISKSAQDNLFFTNKGQL